MNKNNQNQAMISLWQKAILIIFGLFLSLVLLEIGLRLGGFIFLSLQEYRNKISIRQKGTYRIICLGESTTALGGSNSYPSQLEKILNQYNIGIKFSVINRGVVSTTTSHILARLEDNLNQYRPDMVITMMGIMDPEGSLLYKDTIASHFMHFLGSLRTYKLTKLLRLYIITKIKEGGFYEPKEDKGLFRLEASFSNIGFAKQENIIQAEDSFKKAIELNPKNDGAHAGLGWVYRYQGDLSQAEDSFKKAIELNPRNDKAYFGLGRCYIDQEKFTQAEDSFRKAIELNPEDDKAYVGLGWFYQGQGNLSQAEDSFKKAIELNPGNYMAYRALEVLCRDRGDQEAAAEYHKEANARIELKEYDPVTINNYHKLKEVLDTRGIKLVCVQYPACNIKPLKKIFKGQRGIIFVDNEKVFKEAVESKGYGEYFMDLFGGNFGHCWPKGNRLLAENIANVILKEVFFSNDLLLEEKTNKD